MGPSLLELAEELELLSKEFFENRPEDCSAEDDILFLGISAGYEGAAKKVREFADIYA